MTHRRHANCRRQPRRRGFAGRSTPTSPRYGKTAADRKDFAMAYPDRNSPEDRTPRPADDRRESREPRNRNDEYGSDRYRERDGTLASPAVGRGEPMEGGYFTGSDRNYGGGQSNYGSA